MLGHDTIVVKQALDEKKRPNNKKEETRARGVHKNAEILPKNAVKNRNAKNTPLKNNKNKM